MQCKNNKQAGVRVLAVEDSDVMRELMAASLRAVGYSVETAHSGEAALVAARERSFDAFVLDVEMAGMDGLALGRALRADGRTSSSLIAMHTSVDEAEVRAGFDGYDMFLAKPCDVRLLGRRLHQLMHDRRRLPRACEAAQVTRCGT